MDIEKYIKENRPLLARITNRIIGDNKQDFDDVFQEVCLAAVKLGKMYREDKKCKFSTYLSKYAFSLANRQYQYKRYIMRPTYSRNHKIKFDYEIYSLDENMYDGESNEQSIIDFLTLDDINEAENNTDYTLRYNAIRRMFRVLTLKQKYSIIRYYGLFGNKRETLIEIAKKDNITPQSVNKNVAGGINKLKRIKEKYAEWKMTI